MKHTIILIALLALLGTNIYAQRPPTLTDDDVETARKEPVKAKAEEPAKPIPAVKAAVKNTSTKSSWQNFSSAEGGFSILMPKTPQKDFRSVETPNGKLDMTMFI